MMDLFQNLWGLGGPTQDAPTDMSQIKVQPQAVDLAGTIPQANQSLDFKQAQDDYQTGLENQQVLMNGLLGAARSIGAGRKQQQQQLHDAPTYRGGRAPEAFLAEQISGMNMAGQNRAPGLLARG